MGRSGRVLWVALFLGFGLPALVPPAAAHPYHLQVANESTFGSTDQVDDNTWIAQSFTAPTSFRITRVSVQARDADPSDVLRVYIRPSVGGFPATTNLTQGSVDSGNSLTWIDIDLSPWVDLSGGTVYWIVLESLIGSGYDWARSSGESAYPGGIGADSINGAVWVPTGNDYTFRVYGFEQPNLSFATSVSNGNPRPGDNIVFRTNITNSGAATAPFVWVNVTLPPQLAYVSDDAAASNGTRSGAYYFTFTNVAPGLLSFNLTASVNDGVSHGTVVTTSFVFDSTDHNNAPLPRVTQNVQVVVQNALLSFAASVSDGNPRPGDNPVFRADITNSGGADAQTVWVNVTLPPQLAYVSDDAAASGGTQTGSYNYTFTNIAPGLLSFNLTAYVNGGIPDGTVATTPFVFEWTDYGGVPQLRVSRVVPIVIRNCRLFLSETPSESVVDPGDLVTYNATARNVGQETASNVGLEGVLGPTVFFVSTASGATYDPGTRTVRRTGLTVPPSNEASMEWTVRISSSSADGATVVSNSRVTYLDLTGATMLPETAAASVTVRAPVFSVNLTVDPGEAEKGDIVSVTFTYDNIGSVSSPRAWANWTIGSNFALVSLTPTFSYATTGDGFDVPLADIVTSPHAMVARLRVLRGLSDGASMPVEVRWLATDANGNPLSSPTLTKFVSLRAPVLAINASISAPRTEIGKDFVVTVTLRNDGRALANGWLNLTLPADVTFVSDNGSFVVSSVGTTVSWRIPSAAQGSHVYLAVTLRGKTSGTQSFRFALDYTDSAGTARASVLSNAVSVEFFGGGGSWAWWLLPVLAAPLLLFAFLVRRRGTIEEAFLVSHGGLLLSHLSHTIKHERDRDVMSAMLTAIQDFIREAFSNSPQGAVKSIDFGPRKILIRRGTGLFLAVVVKGHPSASLSRRMDETLRKVEAQIPQVTDFVDGAMTEGASEVLSRELLGR